MINTQIKSILEKTRVLIVRDSDVGSEERRSPIATYSVLLSAEITLYSNGYNWPVGQAGQMSEVLQSNLAIRIPLDKNTSLIRMWSSAPTIFCLVDKNTST
jgi:hypothetical protein